MNVEALRALEKAVEAGEFSRGPGEAKRYGHFVIAMDDANVLQVECPDFERIDALFRERAADLIRDMIAQAEAKGAGNDH